MLVEQQQARARDRGHQERQRLPLPARKRADARAEAAFAIGLLGLSWTPLADDVKGKLTEGLNVAQAEEQAPAAKLAILVGSVVGGLAAYAAGRKILAAAPEAGAAQTAAEAEVSTSA